MKKFLTIIFLAICCVARPAAAATNHLYSALSTTLQVVSTTPNGLAGWNLSAGANSTIIFVQFFDASSTSGITLGVTTPVLSLAIPPNGVTDAQPTASITFTHGIVVAATTTATGSGAPSPTVVANIFTQ